MTDDGSLPEHKENYTQGPGERLRRERESRRLSRHDIALEMRIDEHVIDDIEHDRYDDYEPIFINGYLRKYAKLMDLPGDALIADYRRICDRPPPELSATVSHRRVHSEHRVFLYIGYLLAAAFLGMLAAWWLGQIDTVPPPAREVAAPPPAAVTESPPDAGMPVPDAMPGTVDVQPAADVLPPAGMIDTPADVPEGAPLVEQDSLPVPSTPESPLDRDAPAQPGRVLLEFREDSWAEVTDARGNRLMFGLYRKEQAVELEGVPPLEISLGNAAGVEMKYNGKSYDFSSFIRPTGTARFAVE